MSEQRTTPEQRRALRARYTPEPVPTCKHCGGKMVPADFSVSPGRPVYQCAAALAEWQAKPTASQFHLIDGRQIVWRGDADVLALCDDADALAGARAECERLRAALALVLDEMEGCEGRQGMWEDGIDPDYRRAIERGRAALTPGTGGASDGNG